MTQWEALRTSLMYLAQQVEKQVLARDLVSEDQLEDGQQLLT